MPRGNAGLNNALQLAALKEDTGFGTVDVTKRLVDFGMQHYWQSTIRGLCLSHLRWSYGVIFQG